MVNRSKEMVKINLIESYILKRNFFIVNCKVIHSK